MGLAVGVAAVEEVPGWVAMEAVSGVEAVALEVAFVEAPQRCSRLAGRDVGTPSAADRRTAHQQTAHGMLLGFSDAVGERGGRRSAHRDLQRVRIGTAASSVGAHPLIHPHSLACHGGQMARSAAATR